MNVFIESFTTVQIRPLLSVQEVMHLLRRDQGKDVKHPWAKPTNSRDVEIVIHVIQKRRGFLVIERMERAAQEQCTYFLLMSLPLTILPLDGRAKQSKVKQKLTYQQYQA